MTRFDGQTQPRRFKKLRIDEISVVDQPAQGPARVAIMKRAADTPGVETTEKRLALTTEADGHAHMVVLAQAGSEGMSEVRAGQTSFADGHVHDFIVDDAGNVLLADVAGHTHGLAALVTKEQAQGLVAALDAEEKTAKISPAEETPGTSTETEMSQKNENAVEISEAVQGQLDELTAKNERLSAVVSLSSEQRAHFDTLKGDDADAFLKAEDKDAIVKNAAADDPVVHTDLDGNEYRKSADPAIVRLVKSNDELRKQALANEAIAKRAELTKRASDELGHLSGDESAKADLLGAVDGLPTEKREAVLAILKSKDAGMQKAFTEVGTADSGNGAGADAEAKIQTIAKRLRDADATLTPEQAYVKALETPEGQQLHGELIG